ncbi:MAG: hypothetical protein HKN33_18520, partial [Pyrinomonadaceae bacterium]|nr:hypothetical protein [Pyrinomonadaceae bacterium]
MFNKTYYLSIVSIFVLLVFGFIAGHTSLMETASAADDKNAAKEKTGSLPNLSGQQAKDYLEKQGLYKSLNEAIAASRYSIYPTGNAPLPDLKEAFEANNPRQGFSTYFARDGVHLVSTVKSNEWRLHMNLKGLGYGDELTGVVETKTEVEKKKSRIEITKSASGSRDSGFRMVEWYENRKDGLEQGWTIDKKLTDSNEELKLVLELGGDLQARLASDSQAIDFVKNGRYVLRYDKLKSWDADGKELASRMELKGRNLSIVVDDREAVYPITVDPFFVQTKKLTASDAALGDGFGWSVAISGDTAIVGAYANDDGGSDSGSAYIFERNQGGANNWGEVRKLTASDAAAGDNFGYSVAISVDTVIVGAFGNDDGGIDSGSAYIFEQNQGGANNWGEVRKLTASDGAAFDRFGWSVGISGDTAIVGAYGNDDGGNDSGSAYIFERNQGGANNWG